MHPSVEASRRGRPAMHASPASCHAAHSQSDSSAGGSCCPAGAVHRRRRMHSLQLRSSLQHRVRVATTLQWLAMRLLGCAAVPCCMTPWLSLGAASDVRRCDVAGVLHCEDTPQLADPQPETQLIQAAAPQPPAAPGLIRQLQAPLGAGLLAGLLGVAPCRCPEHAAYCTALWL
jgi:hypothetical protein